MIDACVAFGETGAQRTGAREPEMYELGVASGFEHCSNGFPPLQFEPRCGINLGEGRGKLLSESPG